MHDTTEIARADVEYAEGLDFSELEGIMSEGVAETADGCIVEPDGRCPHGHRSPLLLLGYI